MRRWLGKLDCSNEDWSGELHAVLTHALIQAAAQLSETTRVAAAATHSFNTQADSGMQLRAAQAARQALEERCSALEVQLALALASKRLSVCDWLAVSTALWSACNAAKLAAS